MSNLKKHYILFTEVQENGELNTFPIFTPDFIPFKTVISATKLMGEIQKLEDGEKELQMLEKMIAFVADDIYQGKITREDIENKLHAPDALETLKEQIAFVSQGYQTKEAKEFVKKYKA
jgi:hypothetical protein